MNPLLLDSEVQDFIRLHEHDDGRKLVLSHKTIFGIPSSQIAEQILGRGKAKLKLPSWYNHSNILYPATLNLEQTSSEATAKFKVALLKRFIGISERAADLTGGFGVDSFFLSALFKEFHWVDPDKDLLNLVQNNHQVLGATNIHYHSSLAEDFVKTTSTSFDLLYIDPSRRDKNTQKVFRLSECSPDVATLSRDLFRVCKHVLIKTSPLLDVQAALKEIPFVKHIVVVSVSNECKEVLYYSEKDFIGEPIIEAVHLSSQGVVQNTFAFHLSEERKASSNFGDPQRYLYEPGAAVLKSGAFRLVGERYGLKKIHLNTHLYTGDQLVSDFPGRVFEIIHLNPEVRSLQDRKVNIITRNYPLTPDQLKKKFKLLDGGDSYLIGFSGREKKYLVVANRIK